MKQPQDDELETIPSLDTIEEKFSMLVVSNEATESPSISDIKTLPSGTSDLFSLLHVLRSKPPNEKLLKQSCAYIRNLFAKDILTSNMLETDFRYGIVTASFDLMLQNKENQLVQQTCCQILEKLAITIPRASLEIGAKKGVQLLIHTILLHKDSLPVQLHAINALGSLLGEQQNRMYAVQFFGVEALISSLKNHLDAIDLQQLALKTLYRLGEGSPSAPESLKKRGAVKATLRAMRKYKTDTVINVYGTKIVSFLSRACSDTVTEQVYRYRGICIITAAMVFFKDEEVVQLEGFLAVRKLIEDHFGNASLLAELNGIVIMLRAMKRFRYNRKIQEQGIHILHTLAELDWQQAEHVIASGGVEAVLSCMIEFRAFLSIHQIGIAALLYLALNTEGGDKRIVAAGGELTVSTAIKRNFKNEPLLDVGVKLLKLLRDTRRRSPE